MKNLFNFQMLSIKRLYPNNNTAQKNINQQFIADTVFRMKLKEIAQFHLAQIIYYIPRLYYLQLHKNMQQGLHKLLNQSKLVIHFICYIPKFTMKHLCMLSVYSTLFRNQVLISMLKLEDVTQMLIFLILVCFYKRYSLSWWKMSNSP